jgi:hypothetical protein
MMNLSVHTNTSLNSGDSNDSSFLSSSPRRLSQHISDIVTSPTRNRSSSSPQQPTSPIKLLDGGSNRISIEFDGGSQIIVRPNRIVRGRKIYVVKKKSKTYLFKKVW